MKAVLCPVCLGNGLVPNGFYSTTKQEEGCLTWTTSGVDFETCRSCRGKGWVTVPEEPKEIPPISFTIKSWETTPVYRQPWEHIPVWDNWG